MWVIGLGEAIFGTFRTTSNTRGLFAFFSYILVYKPLGFIRHSIQFKKVQKIDSTLSTLPQIKDCQSVYPEEHYDNVHFNDKFKSFISLFQFTSNIDRLRSDKEIGSFGCFPWRFRI